ncbi:arylamine N-acetyltransferase family protein [Ruegeria aquimaris]|uniref:Arylamine N-acetyltransferase n=1 Tax=Ruegeria aquimaris TaxID=2984333 RepID=A0ABT3AHC3_9RHOB|nr:arylamine N-acetyltransferase [Ruegeria sp. XHP0148]MCV2888060.1 arylamine N-acetyltransferase [Ruegeria sp. XHP0148]
MSDFDLPAYLSRIGLDAVPVTPDGLRLIQQAQLRCIPFENIDPFLGRTPDLAPQALAAKLLHAGRGGYCFELNALFGAALRACGFETRRLLARVRNGRPTAGPRSHVALMVTLGGRRYLADAGFGGPGPLAPLLIDTDTAQSAPNGTFCLRTDPVTGERLLQRDTPEGPFILYGFDEAHVSDADIEAANHLCATWEKMPFRNNLLLSGFDGATRIGAFNRMLTRDSDGRLDKRELVSPTDLATLLTRDLGLCLDPATLGAIWTRLGTA